MISLKNKNLVEIIELRLNKLENNFSEKELNNITDIVYDTKTIDGEFIEDDLYDLKYLKNLNSLYLVNAIIGKNEAKNIFSIPSLKNISFDSVYFNYLDFLPELRLNSIAFINTNIENYNFLSEIAELEEIEIVSNNVINLKIFENLKKLKKLNLKDCICQNIDILNTINYIENFGICDTNITDLNFLKSFSNLKRLSISKEQLEKNDNIINKLRENKVKIYIGDIIEY